jgi:glycosyltransferase involved in cell wall biosynthesis
MAKLKILYILTEYLPDAGGGIITHYARILPNLVKHGHDVTVLLASRGKVGESDYQIDGVRVQPIQNKFLERFENRFRRWVGLDIFYYWLPVVWAAWAQAQEKFDYDLVETTDFGLLYVPWIVSEKKSPLVISMHGSFGQVDWFSHSAPRSLYGDLIRALEVYSVGKADVVHANSRSNAEFWRIQLDREIHMIPPVCGKYASNLRKSSPSHKNRAKGLIVGRLENWKGAEVLCQALRMVSASEIEWVGGDTDWGSSGLKASEYLVRNYADVFGKRLYWIGRLDREQVAKKMRAAAYLIVPSLWDVFNLTVVEGMEAGMPVICSQEAGAEILIEHEKSGLLFDPAKPEELAACINHVHEMGAEERLQMGVQAQAAVQTLLNEDRILNLLEDSYHNAVLKGTSQKSEAWIESLFSPSLEAELISKPGLFRRAIRRAGRFLINV